MPNPIINILFLLAAAFALSPWCSPPIALAIGMVLGILDFAAYPTQSRKLSRLLIQCSIVLLGFWISLADATRAGITGLAFSTGAIIFVLLVSEMLYRFIRADRQTTTLLSSGTAICGGSAIAATGSVINATPGAMAVATAIVFILNAIGVYVYPAIARSLELTDHQFGAWAAVGIHDLAGVIAAATNYHGTDAALQDATVIKLTRVLWIAPVALMLGWWHRRSTNAEGPAKRSPFPWYVLFFIAACLLRAALEHGLHLSNIAEFAGKLKLVAGAMLSLALFLIGSGLTRKTLAEVGWRPALHGVILWLIVSAASLATVVTLLRQPSPTP